MLLLMLATRAERRGMMCSILAIVLGINQESNAAMSETESSVRTKTATAEDRLNTYIDSIASAERVIDGRWTAISA